MLDVNLGNKTLLIGVLIALILSYGMVNFDSGSVARQNGPAIKAALQQVGSIDVERSMVSTARPVDALEGHEAAISTQPEASSSGDATTTMSRIEMKREQRRQARM